MIYIRLEGHHFQYEVEDVIKLFYKDEEVIFSEAEPPAEYRGIFLFNRLAGDGDAYKLLTRLADGGVLRDEGECSLVPDTAADELEKQRRLKREIKRHLYEVLAWYTGKEMPWGILTGVRPAKIARELLEKGKSRGEIMTRLKGYYRVSEAKAELLCEVASVEKGILDRTDPNAVGLYIGIPFCTTRCLYCSFTSNPIGKYNGMTGKYIQALRAEMLSVGRLLQEKGLKIQSVYIGGGTPTSLTAGELKQVLDAVEECFDLGYIEEYTMEAGRPDSIDEGKLEAIRNSRVNRISINPQTMNAVTLELIGRSHKPEDIVRAFAAARQAGFDNINMDVIVGLPGENLAMFENTLREIKNLCPESLTVHTMALKRASRLNEEKGKYSMTPGEEAAAMVELGQKYAASMGMRPYYLYRQKNILGNLENIGYCKPGSESIYNVQIMEEKQTIIAMGAGAITKVVYPGEDRIERAFNVKSVEEYIARVDEMVERKRALLEV